VNRKAKILFNVAIIVVALVLVAAAGLFFAYRAGVLKANTDTAVDADTSAAESADVQYKTYAQALTISESKDYAAGDTYLDDKLEETADNGEQAAIYISKANLASYYASDNQSSDDQALEFAYKAESIDPTYTTASTIAALEEATGDKVNALKYYTLKLERMSQADRDAYPDDYDYIKAKITELAS
jgi:hypothetical protein